jgi:hypothetical protein
MAKKQRAAVRSMVTGARFSSDKPICCGQRCFTPTKPNIPCLFFIFFNIADDFPYIDKNLGIYT